MQTREEGWGVKIGVVKGGKTCSPAPSRNKSSKIKQLRARLEEQAQAGAVRVRPEKMFDAFTDCQVIILCLFPLSSCAMLHVWFVPGWDIALASGVNSFA